MMFYDEELDYSPDECDSSWTKNDTKPGVKRHHSKQKKHRKNKDRRDQKHMTRYHPYRMTEKNGHQEGFAMAIGSDHKGFAMLESGTGAGKSGALEPVNKEALRQVGAEKICESQQIRQWLGKEKGYSVTAESRNWPEGSRTPQGARLQESDDESSSTTETSSISDLEEGEIPDSDTSSEEVVGLKGYNSKVTNGAPSVSEREEGELSDSD